MKQTSTSLLVFVLLLLMLPTGWLNAQDIHFSQFLNSPLNLNPGQAGVFGGDLRFVGNYRNQWRSVPVPFLTFSGSLENKIYFSRGRYDRYLTGSLLINYDRQGSLRLTSTQIGIPLSLTLPLGANSGRFLTLGVTPAFGQRAFNTNSITTDAQWFDCMWNSGAPIAENQLFQNASLKYFDLSAGANLRLQAKSKRSRLDLGGAVHHINRPAHDFWSSTFGADAGNVRLYDKLTLSGAALVQVSESMDLLGQGLFQRQGGYREVLYGIAGRLHLNRNPYNELALQLGVDYRQRYSDAFVPHVQVLWRTWTLGFSFDVNAQTDAKLVTDRRAGPELSLIYRLYRVRPVGFKSCTLM
ncbi:MAG TPA: PorP/SprF family type IX secretion system membrane protein [Saprospiraceae bacterium]|nr:PorP/SprF family type IX secretion system membrane protein [Saprospiraceae bacterium]